MICDRHTAQSLVLSSALWNGPQVWDMVDVTTMDDGYRQVGAAMRHLAERGQTVSTETLGAECARRGITMAVDRWAMYPVPAEEAAAAYAEATARVRIEQALLRASGQLQAGVDHWVVADDVTAAFGLLARPIGEDQPYALTWDEVLSLPEVDAEWVLPGLLARGERMVLTGMEGFGKSTLVYQLMLGAAFGVSPMDGDETFQPQRVLVLDVENTEPQIAAQYRRFAAAYGKTSEVGETGPDVRLMSARYIDLTKPGDRRHLVDAANDFRPDLMFLGAGYRLADGTQDHRVVATSIQQTVDQIRADLGCATVIETHAGHGFQNDRNGWRPDGSSYWLRWPEFGIGLEQIKVAHGRMTRLVKWRGDRVTGRDWPAGFRSGGVLPWLPIEEVDIELAQR